MVHSTVKVMSDSLWPAAAGASQVCKSLQVLILYTTLLLQSFYMFVWHCACVCVHIILIDLSTEQQIYKSYLNYSVLSQDKEGTKKQSEKFIDTVYVKPASIAHPPTEHYKEI